MKILMMTNSYFPFVGGIERSIQSFSHEFRRAGHEVMIAAPAWEGRAEDEQYVIRVPAIKKFYHTEFSVNVPLPGLIPKLHKEFTPDIIHSHHPFFLGDLALRMSRQYHIPLVFTYHIMFEKYVHYLPVKNDKARRFVIELAAGYSNLAHHVIAPSDSVRDLLEERGVTAPITVVPSGVDLQKFNLGNGASFRQQNQIPEDAFVIGYVGRLAPEKNLDFLVHCLIRSLKEDPTNHVVFAGGGPSEPMIEDAFRTAGLRDRLHMIGILHDQDLVDAYYAMDVFAFSSVSETQGMVLVEAMAAGVPVVALDATGVRDVVEDLVNGRLIEEASEDEFVQALNWFKLCSEDKKKDMRQQARQTAQKFSKTACAASMMTVYQQLRHQETFHDETADNAWTHLRERMKAEWDLFKNLLEASEAAMHEGALSK